jgi:hypothetical protein
LVSSVWFARCRGNHSDGASLSFQRHRWSIAVGRPARIRLARGKKVEGFTTHRRQAVPLTPRWPGSRVAAQRVIGGDLNDDDPDAIGVLDPHFDQPPGLDDGLPENTYS